MIDLIVECGLIGMPGHQVFGMAMVFVSGVLFGIGLALIFLSERRGNG